MSDAYKNQITNWRVPILTSKGKGTMDQSGYIDNTTAQRLKSFLERWERLEQEKTALGEDIKELKGEIKGVGFDVKVLGEILKRRKMDPEKLSEYDAILNLYEGAIGSFDQTPLGAAISQSKEMETNGVEYIEPDTGSLAHQIC